MARRTAAILRSLSSKLRDETLGDGESRDPQPSVELPVQASTASSNPVSRSNLALAPKAAEMASPAAAAAPTALHAEPAPDAAPDTKPDAELDGELNADLARRLEALGLRVDFAAPTGAAHPPSHLSDHHTHHCAPPSHLGETGAESAGAGPGAAKPPQPESETDSDEDSDEGAAWTRPGRSRRLEGELFRSREHERDARERLLRSYAKEKAARSAAKAIGVQLLGNLIEQLAEVKRHTAQLPSYGVH